MDTIAAISTPLGSGAVGIVRFSGDDALKIADELFRPYRAARLTDVAPNVMCLGQLDCAGISDRCLAVYFAAPNSYTGEYVAEFHCHGGVSLITRVLGGCLERGARAADRGEFTRRAFLNGKLALSDAEGVADMINADSAAAINAGYRLVTGKTSAAIKDISDRLLDSISYMEASLDYPEEMEEESRQDAQDTLGACAEELTALLSTCERGRYIKDGIKVAIIGVTNVGKSSLFNALTQSDRAIVTDIEGTTRDSIDEVIEADGIALRLIDTAGIRKSCDKVETAGIERSKKLAAGSDLVLFVTDGSRELTEEEEALLDRLKADGKKLIIAVNKRDLPRKNSLRGIEISAKTGEGIDEIKSAAVKAVLDCKIDAGAEVITSERHKDAMQRALEHVESARRSLHDAPAECTLLDMRAAYRALGEITGDTADENIIDNIFKKFCLGK